MKFRLTQKTITEKDTLKSTGNLSFLILEVLIQIPIPFIGFNGFFHKKSFGLYFV